MPQASVALITGAHRFVGIFGLDIFQVAAFFIGGNMARFRINSRKVIVLQARQGKSNFDLMCDANVAKSTLHRALKGGFVNIKTIGRLSAALKCDPDQLLIVE
jgi:DNA-binding Xre family transcriptional regulator